jgi:HEAT repeat protein
MTEEVIDALCVELNEQMAHDDEQGCEATAIRLGEAGPAALPAIRALLRSANVDRRFWALRSLWANGGAAAQKLLIDRLGDPEAMIRSGAALVLGELKSTAAVSELMRLLREDEGEAGDHAAMALGKIGQPAAKVLIAGLKSDYALVRLRAAKALTPIESHAAIPALINCLVIYFI